MPIGWRRRRSVVTALLGTVAIAAVAAATVFSDTGPNIRPLTEEARIRIHAVTEDLRSGCYDKGQADALVRTSLAGTGVSDGFLVRTDGPIAYPSGDEDVVRAHLGRGCFIYSGTGLDETGRRVFYISGPDALAAWEAAKQSGD